MSNQWCKFLLLMSNEMNIYDISKSLRKRSGRSSNACAPLRIARMRTSPGTTQRYLHFHKTFISSRLSDSSANEPNQT